jgi:hypothetical protein
MTLTLWGRRYEFLEHPNAPGLVFGQDGSRGSVYQVREDGGALFGLKVFLRDFRVPRLKETAHRLSNLGTRPGLRAAYRRVIARDQRLVENFPALEYAVLMPWIKGQTWYDQLGKAERNRRAVHTASQAVSAAQRFLQILSALEEADIAHTDISSGNVIITPQGEVELLDLEDIYGPGFPKPNITGPGTPGYQHPAKRPTWCPEGDRYAAAILAAELLLLQFDSAANETTTTGFFAEQTCATDAGRNRFQLAIGLLGPTFPNFLRTLEAAWLAPSLVQCPPISALNHALQSDVSGSVILDPPTWGQGSIHTSVDGGVTPGTVTTAHPWGEWVPDAPVTWKRDSDVPVTSVDTGSDAAAPVARAMRARPRTPTPVSASDDDAAQMPRPRRLVFAIIAVLLLLAILILMKTQ